MRHYFTCAVLFVILSINGSYAGPLPVSFGISAGIGLPKIPVSQFRTPISVLGGCMGHVSVLPKWGIQIDGNALTTFSLGTVNQAGGDLKFEILWGSLALTYQLKGLIRSRSNLILGIGKYYLTQQFDQAEESIQPSGMNLGFSNWMAGRKWRGILEVRWHMLFRPGEDPQVLTITYGWLF